MMYVEYRLIHTHVFYTWKKHVQWEAKLFTEKYNENEYQPSAEQPDQNHSYRTELSRSFVMSLTHRWICSIQRAYVIFTCMMMTMMAKRTLKISQPYPDQLQFCFLMFWNLPTTLKIRFSRVQSTTTKN